MFSFDICCCTYNSSKWLNGFISSFRNLNYDKKALHLYFADNASTDDTVVSLQHLKDLYGNDFGSFEILQGSLNLGFGAGSNRAANAGNSEFVFFCNLDTQISPDALVHLTAAIEKAGPDIGAYELRQFPKEQCKYYDPVTLETPWCSGAAMIIPRRIYELTGGFDETIFMYCEDVDLSWRIRLAGFRLQYVPTAVITHFVRDTVSPIESVGEIIGQYILGMKYGNRQEQFVWENAKAYLLPTISDSKAIRLLNDLQQRAFSHRREYRRFYKHHVRNKNFIAYLSSPHAYPRTMDTALLPVASAQNENPLITVIIRTFRRPELLKLTLRSLSNQTNRSFHVLVVEDGENPISEETVSAFHKDLDISYHPIKEHAGRCNCGNKALGLVKTPFVCFLDDDDYFFADYIETIHSLISYHPDCQMFCSDAIEARADLICTDGNLRYRYASMHNLNTKDLSLIHFFATNPVPIQSVVFHISLFRRYGGFDPDLDAFEDWDLWMRYALHCKIATTPQTLSIFHLPADQEQFTQRSLKMKTYSDAVMRKMETYTATFSAQQIRALFIAPADTAPTENIRPYVESYREITASAVWKIAQPLRKCNRFADFITTTFGPLPPKDTDDFHALQRFVEQTKHAPYYRFITGLLNRLRHSAV